MVTENPIQDAIKAFRASTRALYDASQFDELEKVADEVRSSKARYPNGSWKIAQFYDCLECGRNESEATWQLFEERSKAWEKAEPKSVTARVAHAGFLIDYAWHARGSGWGDTVSEEAGKLFDDRLVEARKVLEEARELPAKCPFWWRAMMTVAMGQGWNRAQFDSLFEEAKSFQPQFWAYDVGRAMFLLPRWQGEPGDWEKAAEAEIKRPGGPGAQVYARVVIIQAGYYTNIFKESQASWLLAKQGFEELRKTYPDALEFVGQYARVACLAGDREVAKGLFDELKGRFVSASWKNVEQFVTFRKWANGELATLPLPEK